MKTMMGYFRQLTLVVIILLAASPILFGKYKIIEIQLKAPSEYSSHQNFQEIVIGAYPCETEAKVKEIFDTDKLIEKGFLPVLLVIENNNNFPIRMFEEEVFLVEKSGKRQRSMNYVDVLMAVHLKDPLSQKSGDKQLSIEKLVKKDMLQDFERKSFGEKLIAPYGNDHGVVFFRIPEEGLADSYLYLPEILNVTDGEPLMFFEFPLQ